MSDILLEPAFEAVQFTLVSTTSSEKPFRLKRSKGSRQRERRRLRGLGLLPLDVDNSWEIFCSDDMAKVRYILDLDGFHLKDGFQTRELGLYDVMENILVCQRFYPAKPLHRLSTGEQITVSYATEKVHKMNYHVEESENALPQSHLDHFLTSKIDSDYIVAFKGGNCEKTLLKRLGLRYIDLEKLGCPKISNLFLSREEKRKLFPCQNCPDNNDHCPAYETQAFGRWLSKLEISKCLRQSVTFAHVLKLSTLQNEAKPDFILKDEPVKHFLDSILNRDHKIDFTLDNLKGILLLAGFFRAHELKTNLETFFGYDNLASLSQTKIRSVIRSRFNFHILTESNDDNEQTCSTCDKRKLIRREICLYDLPSFCNCRINHSTHGSHEKCTVYDS